MSDGRWEATTGPIQYSDLQMGERCDGRSEPGPWRPVLNDRARRHPTRSTARAADARDRGAPTGLGAATRPGNAHRRLRSEHGRLGQAGRQRRTRHARADALRGDARGRRLLAPEQPAQRAAARHLRPRGQGRRGLRAALHLPRLSLRRGDRHRRVRADRQGGALRHPAQRVVRVLRRAREPALAQHQLEPARQLHLGARPTARSATSASAGSRTPRCSSPPRR